MQVNTAHRNDALTRHRQRLAEIARKDRARAESLNQQGQENLAQADEKKTSAGRHRDRGEELKKESDRLRRNGREQSLRGLRRLADGSDRYSESFAKQEKGLGDLQSALHTVEAANTSKSGALDKINGGLSEQESHNRGQAGDLDSLRESHDQNRGLTEQKQAGATDLGRNVEARREQLDGQTEQVADFLLAGTDYEAGAEVKNEGVKSLGKSVAHRVQAEALGDTKDHQELQKSWSEADAERHEKAERELHFSSLFQSLKAKAAEVNAQFHQAAARKGEMKADELESQATQMRARADGLFQHGRALECSGHHHVAIGQQMKCYPWSYCQGVMLERQGFAELAQAQKLKRQAQDMRRQAQEKALEAETARVKAEQAGQVGNEFEVAARGSQVRSEILSDRSESHETRAQEQKEQAARSAEKAEQLGRLAAEQQERATALHQQGVTRFSEGVTEQKQALQKQGGAMQGFANSVTEEDRLQERSTQMTGKLSGNLSAGRSFLGRSKRLVASLRSSVNEEKGSQQKVRSGIDEFSSSLATSVEATGEAKEAAAMLEQARELELEGLRLQNRGQKMLLEARPKMADAARLSAESFDAFKKAGREEEEAETLISQGNEKLAAARILREKARAYQTLAESA